MIFAYQPTINLPQAFLGARVRTQFPSSGGLIAIGTEERTQIIRGNSAAPAKGSDLYQVAQKFVPDLSWNYVIDGVLRLGEVSTLYGPSNSGKTALLGYAASCITSGQNFFDAATRRGIVVHVAAEAPISVLERSVAYREDVRASAPAPYLVRMKPVDFFQFRAVSAFIQELRRQQEECGEPIVLVIVDTLARCMGDANENDAGAMTTIANHGLQVATAINTHVCFVHHTGKQEDRGARGSYAIRSAVETELALIPSAEGEGVALQPVKQGNLPMGGAMHFKTVSFTLGEDENGKPRTTVKAVPVDAPAVSTPAQKHDRRSAVLTALHILQAQKGGGAVSLTTREIVDALPPIFLSGIADTDGRAKAINRIMGDLSKLPGSRLSGTPGAGWKLAPPPKSEVSA